VRFEDNSSCSVLLETVYDFANQFPICPNNHIGHEVSGAKFVQTHTISDSIPGIGDMTSSTS